MAAVAPRRARLRTAPGLESPGYRQGIAPRWAAAVRDEEQVSRLRKLWESLEMEILSVLEATNRLHESAEFELHELLAKKPEMFDSVVGKQTGQIEAEIIALKGEADQMGKEIEELTGKPTPGCLNSKAGL